MIQRLSETLSRFAFLATGAFVSVALSGFVFIVTVAQNLGVNISVFETDIYSFLSYMFYDVNTGHIVYVLTAIAFIISFAVFPKTINWFLGIVYFTLKILKKIVYPIFNEENFGRVLRRLNRLSGNRLKRFIFWLNRKIVFIQFKIRREVQVTSQKFEMKEAVRQVNRAYSLFMLLFFFVSGWLLWIFHFSTVANNYTEKLKQDAFTHTIYVIEKEQIKELPCTFVSKIKNGYLIMVAQEGNKEKVGTIITDNFVYKLEPIKKPA